MGLHRREPAAAAAARRAARRAALPQRRRAAGVVPVSARHGARAGRAEPAVEPGAGADLRAGVGQGALMATTRRALLAAAAALPLAGCGRDAAARWSGGWVGTAHERGHRLRETRGGALPAPALQRHAGVLVVGAGVAGLACARALSRAGIDDVQVLDLEDAAGGNSRAHRI